MPGKNQSKVSSGIFSVVKMKKIPNDPKEPYHELFPVYHLKIPRTYNIQKKIAR